MKTLWLGAELLCHYHLHYDPSLNAGIGPVTASSLALIWFSDTCHSGSTSRDFGSHATMATFYSLSDLADVVLDAWILFLVDEMESTKLLAWWFQGGYCSLILALANAGSHGSLTPQSNYKNCATLAVNDQAEYNFIHLLDVWSFLGGQFNLFGTNNKCVFFFCCLFFSKGHDQ